MAKQPIEMWEMKYLSNMSVGKMSDKQRKPLTTGKGSAIINIVNRLDAPLIQPVDF
ncbi:MAG: hypothetical protein P4L50_07560 [Anaerolineaceae bacterium]|nr:hypothetical protein [Anaerolineaceae bacterium]